MDTRLANLVLQVIRENWSNDKQLRSEVIHQQLLARGEQVPEGALHEIFQALEHKRLIRTSGSLNNAGIQAHGSVTMTGDDPCLL